MEFKKFNMTAVATASMALLLANQAWSAGYERSIMWGARSAAVGGIATPYISGAQALYFNPAGLATAEQGAQLSVQVSPVWSKFSGPINNQNDEATSKQALGFPFGLMYSRMMGEKWGFGVGGYVSGGSDVNYEDVDLGTVDLSAVGGSPTTAFDGKGNVKTKLVITEVSAGVGYNANENLKLGAAWRVVMGTADFSLLQRLDPAGPAPSGAAIANFDLTGLKDTSYTGFRLGAQYRLSDKTTFGASFRSEVKLDAEGKAAGRAISPSGVTDLGSADATASTTFPMALTLGANYNMSEQWKLMWEYVFTQYSKVENITVNSTLVGGEIQVVQNWKDQHNARLGAEYLGAAWPVRFGYVWTSQVTDTKWARASFTPPGAAHSLTLGTGQMLTVKEMPLQFDVAGEYTMVQGDGEGAAAGDQAAGDDIRAGTYKASAYSLHLGLTYAF